MASFETIVRPMIIPNIRPAPARALPPEDDPDQGKCVIGGGGASPISQSYSFSSSIKRAGAVEIKRQFDEVRIRSSNGGGSSTRSTRSTRAAGDDDAYIDVEVVKKLWLKGGKEKFTRQYAEVQPAANVEVRRRDVTRYNQE